MKPPAREKYSVWIEAETWPRGQWNIDDDNCDVTVTFSGGQRWTATFITYRNIQTLIARNRQDGGRLAGAYLCADHTVLIDQLTRQRIEEVVKDLLRSDDFAQTFESAD
jgi:hypothetical protein